MPASITGAIRPTAVIDFPEQPGEPASARLRLAFGAPERWLIAQRPEEVPAVLDEAHRLSQRGCWVVGLVRFEAATAFDPAAECHPADGPLACFAAFAPSSVLPASAAQPPGGAGWHFTPWADPLDEAAFTRDVQCIHELIRDGEVYQINFTSMLSSRFGGDALAAFAALQRAQPGGYAVYLDTRQPDGRPGETVLSVSPELFFDWRGGRLLCQPMKGTAPRGRDAQADAHAAQQLRASEKERAENLMIVDLLRNDLARIAQTGSVRVPALFEVQALPTVWQMTSTIEARARDGLALSDVFAALFPCGSVTGAPKLRALHHIRRLEAGPRGVYCGAIGVLAPGGAATFNVAIRTVVLHSPPLAAQAAAPDGLPHQAMPAPDAAPIGPFTVAAAASPGGAAEPDHHDHERPARCGIGSGITLDATVAGEAAEWRHKQRFLARAAEPFALLESLLLADGRWWLLDEHLARLQASAAALGHACPPAQVQLALREAAAAHPRGRHKVRLLLTADGSVTTEAQPLAARPAPIEPLAVVLADRPIDAAFSPGNDFIRHKTTRREAYAAYAPPPGCFDTLLWNARGELTEFTLGNVALMIDGRWLTPDEAAGLLPGTYRTRLLRQRAGEPGLHTARLTLTDLQRAQAAAFFNSVRGWLPVDLTRLQVQACQRGRASPASRPGSAW
ncbi:MAG: chorismate-binding protein [Pseudomonadota bacterium]